MGSLTVEFSPPSTLDTSPTVPSVPTPPLLPLPSSTELSNNLKTDCGSRDSFSAGVTCHMCHCCYTVTYSSCSDGSLGTHDGRTQFLFMIHSFYKSSLYLY